MSSEHVQVGQPLEIRSDTWNQIIDAKNAVLRKGRGVPEAGVAYEPSSAVVKIKVTKDTPKGKVMELASALLTPDKMDDYHIWFNAETPALAQNRVAAVLLEPIPANGIGRAQITGACRATVAISNTAHRYAVVKDGSDELASANIGPIRILCPPTVEVDSSELLPVLLGWSAMEIHRGFVDNGGSITKGGQGTVSRYDDGTDTDSTLNDTVKNDWATIGNSKKCAYVKIGSNYYMLAGECPLT